MAKNVTNEQLVAALLNTDTIRKAAEVVGLTERAIYARMKQPEFQEIYNQARSDLLNAATARLQSYTSKAITTLVAVMDDDNAAAQVKINAAVNILLYCLRFTEKTDVLQRIEALEAKKNNPEYTDELSKSLEEMAAELRSDDT